MFLISNSTCSFLLQRRAMDFCVLTLYPATLLWSLIKYRRLFLLILWDFLDRQCTKTVLFLPDQSCIPSISFSYTVALARTSSRCWISTTALNNYANRWPQDFQQMLNRSGERERPDLFLTLARKHLSSFSSLCVTLAAGVSRRSLSSWSNVPSLPSSQRVAIMNRF